MTLSKRDLFIFAQMITRSVRVIQSAIQATGPACLLPKLEHSTKDGFVECSEDEVRKSLWGRSQAHLDRLQEAEEAFGETIDWDDDEDDDDEDDDEAQGNEDVWALTQIAFELHSRTQADLTICCNALAEAGGDLNKAEARIRKEEAQAEEVKAREAYLKAENTMHRKCDTDECQSMYHGYPQGPDGSPGCLGTCLLLESNRVDAGQLTQVGFGPGGNYVKLGAATVPVVWMLAWLQRPDLPPPRHEKAPKMIEHDDGGVVFITDFWGTNVARDLTEIKDALRRVGCEV